ncbi:hypothetical protein CY35_10G053000 [Sphagnum magellanicum]|nr:hypothetical protein CY35_10G053000 [Sphagnum magellanicum]
MQVFGMLRLLHLKNKVATMATHVIPGSAPLDAVRQQKKALRTLVRRQLRALPPLAKQQEDEAIQKHVLATDWFRNSQRVCAYVSCASLREVETSKIMAYLLQRQHEFPEKKVYVPRIEDKESHMCMLHITNIDEDLVANSMNILEPTPLMPLGNPRANMMESNEPVDLFLLPGLAFDKKGGRLGRGGGYYDLFLQNYLLLAKDKGWKQPLLVALAYSVQIQEDLVPMTSTDVNIDALVSCDGIHPFSSQMSNTSSS